MTDKQTDQIYNLLDVPLVRENFFKISPFYLEQQPRNFNDQTDGWMNGRADGFTNGRTDGQTDGRTNGRMDGCMHKLTDEWKN